MNHRTRSTWAKVWRFTWVSSLALMLICAAAAAGLIAFVSQFGGDSTGSMVMFYDRNLNDVLQDGAWGAALAWLAMTGGLVIAFFAVLFACGVTVLVLGFSFGLVALVGLLMAAPVLVVVALIVWLVRRPNRGAHKLAATA